MIKHTHILIHTQICTHKQTTEGKTEGLSHHLIMIMTYTDARRVLVSLNHLSQCQLCNSLSLSFLCLIFLCSWKLILNNSQTAVNQCDSKPYDKCQPIAVFPLVKCCSCWRCVGVRWSRGSSLWRLEHGKDPFIIALGALSHFQPH